jgi:uncharacterized protein YtpQ (UPF0354 family)
MGIFDFLRRDTRALTQEQFAAIVLKRMGKSKLFSHLTYDADPFRIRFNDSRNLTLTFNLRNVYKDYQKANRKDKLGTLDKYIQAFVTPAEMSNGEAALQHLMPVIRDKSMFEYVALTERLSGTRKPSNVVPTLPFFEHLVMTLVVDAEHSTTSVNHGKLADWNVDFSSALKIAIDNLRDRTESKFTPVGRGVFVSAWSDVFDASRLLLTDMLHRLPIKGEPVIAIPSRNHLLVTGNGNEPGIHDLIDIAADILANDTRPLAAQLFHFHDGTWKLFDGGQHAREKLAKPEYMRRAGAYADQKKLLDQIHVKEKIDIFVASYRVYENPALGGLFGVAQLTRGVVTLIPKADYIWFYCNQSNEIISVPWQAAERALTALSGESSYYPELFLVNEFPHDDQLTTLKQSAVSCWKVADKQIPSSS